MIGGAEIHRSPAWLAQSPFPLAEVRHATTDSYLQLQLARQGFGIVKTIPLLAKDSLVLVPVQGIVLQSERNIWILLHSDLRRTRRARRFVDFLADELLGLKARIQGNV